MAFRNEFRVSRGPGFPDYVSTSLRDTTKANYLSFPQEAPARQSGETLVVENKKPGIYLAGPMAECSDTEMTDWRDQATKALQENFIVYNPVKRDFRGQTITEEIRNLIVEGDKEDIDNSDIVLINYFRPKALPPMVGTSMECIYAWENEKLVVLVDNGLSGVSPWLRYHSDVTFPNLNEALDWCNAWSKKELMKKDDDTFFDGPFDINKFFDGFDESTKKLLKQLGF